MSDELPQGWAKPLLGEVVRVKQGNSKLTKKFYKPDGKYVAFSGSGPDGLVGEYEYEGKAIVLSAVGARCGKCFKADGQWTAIANTAVIRPLLSDDAHYDFLFYLLNNEDFWPKGGTAQPFVQTGLAQRETRIPLAPLGEQRRIVAKLEKLLGKVDACQQRLAKIPVLLKRFRQSVLAAACSGRLTADWREEKPDEEASRTNDDSDLPLSWSAVQFGELIGDGPQNGIYKPASFYGDGTLIVRIDAFYDGAIEAWDELKRVRLTEKERTQFALRNGDILVNRVNSPKFLGKSALVRKLKEPCVYESNMMRLRLDTDRALPDYAILYLQSFPGLVELRKNAKHAVNQSSINQEDVKSAMFNLPPLAEQHEIVRRVEGLFALADQIESRFQKARAQVDKLTPSLLAKAFRGQLVPQDPNDEPAEKLLERIRVANNL